MYELKKQKLISKGWSISNNPFEFLDDISGIKRSCEQQRFSFIKNQIEYLQDELRDLYWKKMVESITTQYINLYNMNDCYFDFENTISIFDGKFQDRYLRIIEEYNNDSCITAWIDNRGSNDQELCIVIEYSLVNEQILKNLIKYWLIDKKDKTDMIKLINTELKHQRIDL